MSKKEKQFNYLFRILITLIRHLAHYPTIQELTFICLGDCLLLPFPPSLSPSLSLSFQAALNPRPVSIWLLWR